MALHGHGVELWGYFWSFSLRSDVHEVFGANYASRKTARRILSAWKFVWDLRTKQNSKSPCSSKATASRENHPGNWIHCGYCFNPAKFTLYPSWHIFGCVFAWRWWMFTQCMAIRITTRSALNFTCICHLCMRWEFLQHSCQFKLIYVSPDIFVCIPHVYEGHKRRHGAKAVEVHSIKSTY